MTNRTGREWQEYLRGEGQSKQIVTDIANSYAGLVYLLGGFQLKTMTLVEFNKKKKTAKFADTACGLQIELNKWTVLRPRTTLSEPKILSRKPVTATSRAVRNACSFEYEAQNEHSTGYSLTDTTGSETSHEASVKASVSIEAGISGSEVTGGAHMLSTLGLEAGYTFQTQKAVEKAIQQEREKSFSGTLSVPAGKAVKFFNTHFACEKQIIATTTGEFDATVVIDYRKCVPNEPAERFHRKRFEAEELSGMVRQLLNVEGKMVRKLSDYNRSFDNDNAGVGNIIDSIVKTRTISEETKYRFPSSDELFTKIIDIELEEEEEKDDD